MNDYSYEANANGVQMCAMRAQLALWRGECQGRAADITFCHHILPWEYKSSPFHPLKSSTKWTFCLVSICFGHPGGIQGVIGGAGLPSQVSENAKKPLREHQRGCVKRGERTPKILPTVRRCETPKKSEKSKKGGGTVKNNRKTLFG